MCLTMDKVTKEHIKYQFCNVYSDLISDINDHYRSGKQPENENDSDSEVILPAPEIKAPAPPIQKRRGRPRKSDCGDRFSELKESRSKRKSSSSRQSDITASFNTSLNTADNGLIKVVADVHRDASQPPEGPTEAPTRKDEPCTTDEIFESLLDKKSEEIDITCSQDSDDCFQVTKRSRRSYPGASAAKKGTLVTGKRFSRGSLCESKKSSALTSKPEGKPPKKKLNALSNKLFEPSAQNPNVENFEEKLKSSPGWSRVKAVAKDFKDLSHKKPLNISISKPRQSASKSTSFVPVSKTENTSGLNLSTSDADISDLHYFDSPEAAKRSKLMKHIVDVAEKTVLDKCSTLEMDPVYKELAVTLTQDRNEYMKKLISSVKNKSQQVKDEEIGTMGKKSPSKIEEDLSEIRTSKMLRSGVQQSPEKVVEPSDQFDSENQETQFEVPIRVGKIFESVGSLPLKSPLSTKTQGQSEQGEQASKEDLPHDTEILFNSANEKTSGEEQHINPIDGEAHSSAQDGIQSNVNTIELFSSAQTEKETLDPKVSDANLISKPSLNSSIVCLGEYDYDSESEMPEDVPSPEKLSSARKSHRNVSPDKCDMSEFSNCDVSETPLASTKRTEVTSSGLRKLNTKSQDLDNLQTQIVSQSVGSQASRDLDFDPTVPLISSQNLCYRCKCSIPDSVPRPDRPGDKFIIKTEFIETNTERNSEKDTSAPRRPQKDASVQTDDVLVSEIRATKESSIQTMPLIETKPCREMADEKFIRSKDEYILQMMKSLMIQASHKLTINDLYNLGFEQENEPPRKKLKEITGNHAQNPPKFEEEAVRVDTLLHQSRAYSANRVTGDSGVQSPCDIRTPVNQVIKRRTTSDMKYTAVSTPSSSERKGIDEAKFTNRSTICLRDVTVCETEEAQPEEDSIVQDVVPMDVESDFPTVNAADKTEVPIPEEREINKFDVIRVRDKMSSSDSNDSVVLNSRKSVHRSLDFQSFFARGNDKAMNSPSKTESSDRNSEFPSLIEGSDNRNMKGEGSNKLFSFSTRSENSPNQNNQHDEFEFSEDIRKSLSVFPECMDTQKPDAHTESGIVENSDDDSIIQATPKKTEAETSLTPDMLSSQNSQMKKEDSSRLHPTREESSPNSCRPEGIDASAKFCSSENAENSACKNPNSIDSQVNEIPSSLLPTVEDCFPKRLMRRNSLYNHPRLDQTENQNVSSHELEVNNPPPPNINQDYVLPNEPSVSNPPPPFTEDYYNSHASGMVMKEPSEPQRLFITTSGLTKPHMFKVQEFCRLFNCVYESEITERTTHLLIRTVHNRAMSTLKFIIAVATHKLVVSMDWMMACVKARELLPEFDFIPLSSTGRAGPLNSLRDKANAISSPLFNQFIIHIIPPFPNFKTETFLDVLRCSGAKIAENYMDLLSDKSRIRLVLINSETAEEKGLFYHGLIQRYKAFIISHDWAIESVSNYRIEPLCSHNPLSVMYSYEMIKNFQIPDYIRDQVARYLESNDESYDETVSDLSHLP